MWHNMLLNGVMKGVHLTPVLGVYKVKSKLFYTFETEKLSRCVAVLEQTLNHVLIPRLSSNTWCSLTHWIKGVGMIKHCSNLLSKSFI